ncbi:MAG: acetolactate synthase large subunit [Pseudomonadota bacterium]
MNGAESLVKTLLQNGVDTCFANPGTSEMHFVAALDAHPDMRCVLCLFEGGTSGAADGYARMTGQVSATLLHLAPGFGNAFANLHNARKAGSGIVNIVGDHATHHLRYESPLKGNVEGVSQSVSHWTRVAVDAASVGPDGAAAISAARSAGGQIATLILPANTAWDAGGQPATAPAPPPLLRPSEAEVEAAAQLLSVPGTSLMLGGSALFGADRMRAGRIAARTGCTLLADTLVARMSRGAGTPPIMQLAYPVDQKRAQLAQVHHLVLCGTDRPVAFFAYPGKPSLPEPAGCGLTSLCDGRMDVSWTLCALADALGVEDADDYPLHPLSLPDMPTGSLTLEKAGQVMAALLPEQTIIVNESVTAGVALNSAMGTARPHDVLATTGGSIGQCLPCAVGAAIACPDRKVVALTGDGSAMYTLQSLWTMARERLDIVIVVVANRGYQILHGELQNVGVSDVGRNAQRMFDLVDPDLDWVALAQGHGVPGARVEDMESFADAFARGLATEGPFLVELVAP